MNNKLLRRVPAGAGKKAAVKAVVMDVQKDVNAGEKKTTKITLLKPAKTVAAANRLLFFRNRASHPSAQPSPQPSPQVSARTSPQVFVDPGSQTDSGAQQLSPSQQLMPANC